MSHFFKAKVCTKAIKPDYVDESALVVLAARVGAYDAGPRMVSSDAPKPAGKGGLWIFQTGGLDLLPCQARKNRANCCLLSDNRLQYKP